MSKQNKTAKNKRGQNKYTRKNYPPSGNKNGVTSQMRKSYINNLKRNYPNCRHDGEPSDSYEGHCVTYGEMEYNGIQQYATTIFRLFSHGKRNIGTNEHIFIDIGCGNGKFPLFMASYPCIKRSIGIELVKSRYENSQNLLSSLSVNFGEITQKVEFFNMDMLKFNFRETANGVPCFIWISNLCFPSDITHKLFDKLHEELPEGSIIGCSKHPFNGEQTSPDKQQFHFMKKIHIPMSWKKEGSEVFFFTVK